MLLLKLIEKVSVLAGCGFLKVVGHAQGPRSVSTLMPCSMTLMYLSKDIEMLFIFL